MKKNPKVSVIIPTYNTKPEWLRQAIRSVLDQTYTNIELLVVDDCSETPFSGVEKDIADQRIHWLRNQSNAGVSATRNYGARFAQGEYLAFLDADDWWEQNKLKSQLQALQDSGLNWSYSSANLCDIDGKNRSTLIAGHQGNVLIEILQQQVIIGSCSSVVVKKSVFEATEGFDAVSHVVEDWDLWIRLSRNNPVTCVNAPVVNLRTGNPGSRTFDAKKLERLRNLQTKHWSLIVEHGLEIKAKGHYECVKARLLLRAGDYIAGSVAAIRCLVLHKGIKFAIKRLLDSKQKVLKN